MQDKNIIITGERESGKSRLVRFIFSISDNCYLKMGSNHHNGYFTYENIPDNTKLIIIEDIGKMNDLLFWVNESKKDKITVSKVGFWDTEIKVKFILVIQDSLTVPSYILEQFQVISL